MFRVRIEYVDVCHGVYSTPGIHVERSLFTDESLTARDGYCPGS
jgi:hypothetical protein